jgi:hypothetical protein
MYVDGIGGIVIMTKVSPLTKISLTVAANAPGKNSPEPTAECLFSFIYGAASGGLCPFEIHLADRHAGEAFDLTVNQNDFRDFFGHLSMPLQTCLNRQILPLQLHLRITINSVEKANDFEVVKAMKEYLGSGCGGGCGCGCH